jgi:uncharacterized repeat protein (TIGR01451 family)
LLQNHNQHPSPIQNLREKVSAMIMKNLFKKTILVLSVIMAAATFAQAQTVDPANPYAFEKKAYKPDGTPWAGPVNVGDIVKYVLSYKPGTAPSGPATIDDTLSPNQSYVAPTVGHGWTWGASPYSSGNHETYSNTGFGPGTGSVKVKISTAAATPTLGSGDGTIPIPVLSLNRVFTVYHHSLNANGETPGIDCWELSSLTACPGYPKASSTGITIATPLVPKSVVRDNKIFFIGFRKASVGASDGLVTIGCFDAAAEIPCADTPLDPSLNGSYGSVGGIVEDPVSKKVFAVVAEKVFCREWIGSAWSNCSGWTMTGNVAVSPTPVNSYAEHITDIHVESSAAPDHIFVSHGSGVIQCLTITNGSACAGWPAAGKSIGGASVALSSVPDNPGTGEKGVCLWDFYLNPVGCVDKAGLTIATSSAGSSNGSLSSLRILGQPIVFMAKRSLKQPACLSYSSGIATPCVGFAGTPPAGSDDYGMALDPTDPENCMLAVGHTNLMRRIDIHTGEGKCKNSGFAVTPDIKSLYCNGAPDPAKFQWDSVKILTSGVAGTLSITKGTSSPITLVITSGTASYAMPSGIGTGYDQLKFTFTPSPGSPVSVDLEIGYTSDKNPEICYQAKVDKCGPVFNDAVFKGSYNGGAISVPKKVDLGLAKGPSCEPPPPPPTPSCLSGKADVTCGKVQGTYNIIIKPTGVGGVVPTSVTITPITTGITLTPALASYPVIGGQVQVAVNGASLGQTLEFEVNGTTAGGGSVAGVDLCCNGKIKVEIPKDLPCKDLIPVDLAIKKTGGTTPAPDVPAYVFALNVTNEGPAYSAAPGVLKVTDIVPAGMVFNSVTGSAGWACAPNTNVPAGTTITCTYAGGGLAAGPAAPVGTININATALGKAPFPDFKNCADVTLTPNSGAGDTVQPNNHSCVTVSKNPKKSDIKIEKICDPVTEVIGAINHFEAKCHITVTSNGPQTGTIVVSEAMTGGTVLSATAPAPWNCTTANCSINGSALNQTSSSTVIDIVVKIKQGEKAARNCARLSQTNANPIESCVDIPTDSKKPVDLKIEKTGLKDCVANAPCPFKVTITSIGQPYNGNILLYDVLTPNVAWPVTSIVPNICGSSIPATPFGCVANLNLAADTPFSFVVTLNPVTPNALESDENCITIATVGSNVPTGTISLPDLKALANASGTGKPSSSCWRFNNVPPNNQSSLTVTKTCDPAMQIPGSKMASAMCHITVTGIGTLPPVIQVNESFNGLGNAANQMTTVTSAQNWGHPPLPIADGVVAPFTLPSADLLAAGGTSTIDVKIQLFDLGTATESKNCVDAVGTDPAGTPMVPVVTAPKVCVNLTATQPPVTTKPVDSGPKCDLRTTKPINDTCRCFIKGQTPISQTACGCPKGTELQRGQCVKPKPECQQGTRFSDARNRCEPICKNGQEYNPSRNVCLTPKPVCKQGTRYNPPTNSCVVDKPVCKRGQAYDAATNRCVNTRPVCQSGTKYNPKRNTCVPQEQRCQPGTIKVGKRCVAIPRCRFPEIPVPGTGLCINPFGGGGKRDQPRDQPKTDGGIGVPGL